MYKVIVEHFAWPSKKFDIWHENISNLMRLDYCDGQLKREWPWPESIEYLYSISNRETIILTFKSKGDWEEIKSHYTFSKVFDFESLDFFVYLKVSFSDKTILIGTYLE